MRLKQLNKSAKQTKIFENCHENNYFVNIINNFKKNYSQLNEKTRNTPLKFSGISFKFQ